MSEGIKLLSAVLDRVDDKKQASHTEKVLNSILLELRYMEADEAIYSMVEAYLHKEQDTLYNHTDWNTFKAQVKEGD